MEEAAAELRVISPDQRAESVQEVVLRVREELHRLSQQRAQIMLRIGVVKKTIVGLAALFGDSVLSKDLRELALKGSGTRTPGLTGACRAVLIDAKDPLSARAVRDEINERSPGLLSRHKDSLASVTTVLNRLADYGEAERVWLSNGMRGWQWVAESQADFLDNTGPPATQSADPSQGNLSRSHELEKGN